MKRYLPYALWVLLLVSEGCTSDGSESNEPAPIPYELKIEGGQNLLFGAEEQTLTLRFSASHEWTARVDQGWCQLSKTRGEAGDQQLQITAAANPDYEERNATLILKTGDQEESLLIVQKFADALLLTSSKVELGREGGEFLLEMKATGEPQYTIQEAAREWLSVVTTRSLDDYTLRFEADENPSPEKREGRITIRCGERSEEVVVYQQGAEPQLLLTANREPISSRGGELRVEIQSNVRYVMTLPEVDWVVESEEHTRSSYTHFLTILPNEGYDNRTAEVLFTCEQYNLQERLTITQLQQDAILIAEPLYELSNREQTLAFEVEANVDFEVEVSTPWIQRREATRALTKTPLMFQVEANPNTEERRAEITIAWGDLKQTIQIVQDRYRELRTLSILHNNTHYTLPDFTGEALWGVVDWGDSTSSPYVWDAEQSHTYTEQNDYRVIIEIEGADEVTFENFAGVYQIDFSAF